MVEATRVESVEHVRAGRKLAQVEKLRRKPPQRRETAHGALQPAVRIPQPRADDGGLRMGVCERGELLDGALVQPRVGVEQQDIPARGPRDAAVPAVGEATVLLLHDLHFGESLTDERNRVVARTVVDDDRLVPTHTRERLLEPRQPVVGDDHH